MVPRGAGAALMLDDRSWAAIDAIGRQHRLLPLLHHHIRQLDATNCPAELRNAWREAARSSTLSVLMAKGDLLRTITLLATRDIAPIVLKGGYLAFACYPQPGLRPLRDLDLWVEADEALAAFHLLVENGYRPLDPGDPAQALAHLHQLPALEAPSGTPVELHVRLGHGANSPDPRAHARRWKLDGQELMTPSPALMLLHIIIHAAYDHRFDNGPITLPDAALIIAHEEVDADEWARLSAPWRRGCDLVFTLLDAYRFAVPDHLRSGGADPAALAMAAALMTQDMEQRDAVRTAAGPSLGLSATLFPDEDRRALLYGRRDGGWRAHWGRLLMRRLPALLRGHTASDARQIRNIDAAFRAWLENPSQ
ncbi:nucleotidyltransferase family protein [Sphingomicrobium flavum]|uniref:nucleotidyltransferase family protein n=1 Tax=Sphingomicrobium flavum TaxID=1229164 RepID=UPI0021ADB2E2|nr:nucleotidyltransferase family protein [Sphingomicrobium flavum]